MVTDSFEGRAGGVGTLLCRVIGRFGLDPELHFMVYGARGMHITLQYFGDCPNWRVAEQRLRKALTELGRPDETIGYQRVETAEEAERVGFAGSPTILIDGVDPFADPAGPAGYACRVYAGDAAPTVAQLRRALSDALAAPSAAVQGP
jgi:hypothetical protein